MKASQDYLEPVYEQLHRELLAKEVLHADETTLQVLHEPGKEPQSKSYMWLYRTSGDTDNPVVMYEYQSGRGAVHPREFLEGFKGYLHADGYAGYHNLPEDITVVGCWAHLRRKFDEAMKSLPKSKAKNSSAAQGLAYCSLLFGLEDDFAELTPDERYQQRLEQANRLAGLREVYYQGLRQQETQVRRLRHDLRNHLTAVRGFLEQGDEQGAIGYLDQIAGSPALRGTRRLCENEAANAVLTAKAEAMEREGVAADFAVSLPRDLPVADMDLCALLGNALDNAIEGSRGAGERRITIRCKADKGLFMLRVENTLGGAVQPDLATTKTDKAAHGFGIPGMREIAERYGGTLDAGVRDNGFELVVCLPLAGQAETL